MNVLLVSWKITMLLLVSNWQCRMNGWTSSKIWTATLSSSYARESLIWFWLLTCPSISYTSTNSSVSSPTQLFRYAFLKMVQTCLKLFKWVHNCLNSSKLFLNLSKLVQAICTSQQIRQRLHQFNCFGMYVIFSNCSNLSKIVQINLNLSKLDYTLK